MAILRIRDENGVVQEIVALRGEKGEKGDRGESGAGKELENNSTVFNDYVNNVVFAKYSDNFGTNNTAGHKGYPIYSLVLAEDKLSATVTLADNDFFSLYGEHPAYEHYTVDDVVQLDIAAHWYNSFVITNKDLTKDGNTVLTIAYPTGEEILKNMALSGNRSENWLWVVSKQVGLPIEVQKGIAVFGDSNLVAGRGAFSGGRNNTVIGDYSGAVGRDNIVGYAGFGCGWGNQVGQNAFAANYFNIASGTYAASFGEKNQSTGQRAFTEGYNCKATGRNAHAGGTTCTAQHDGAFVFGNCLKSAAPNQTLFGKYGTATKDMLFMVGNGNSKKYSHAIAVYEDGHAEIGLQGYTKNSVVTIGYVDQLLEQIEQLKQAIVMLGGTIPATRETEE